MALPGRVEERGAAWAVVYPGEVTGDVVELIFDNEAGARQTLHIFQLRHCLRTPGFESAVGRLIAEVQVRRSTARRAGATASAGCADRRCRQPVLSAGFCT
jgi:hypothetical protein